MKNLLFTAIAVFLLVTGLAQIDRSQRPEPGPASLIEIGQAKSFTLENGLRVFVVENSKMPRVTFSLVFDYDPMYEGELAGLKDITGQMLKTATAKRTKEMIDDEIDFIGASMSAGAWGVYASGISRHTEVISELLADVVINARFEQEHFDRIIKQNSSGLAAAMNEPSSIAGRVNNVLLYGPNHPYGVNMTEESIQRLSPEMCREFYQEFFRPEVTLMAIVGDVKFETIKSLVEKHFKSWKPGNVPTLTYPTPQPPKSTRVAIVDRPNAVQSVIRIGFPVDLKPGAEDLISVRVMNSILGGSTSRLFDNLRETHGFTYGAYSDLSSDKLIGSFTAYTDVRNMATDSAIHEILYEINRMRTERVEEDELRLYKNEMNGSFALSLESPQTIANFALNTARYNLPQDYYATYLQRLAAVTETDVKNAAGKYLFSENANILVVGKASEIAESLKKFTPDNRILYFDEDGNEYDPDQKLKPVPEGMDATKVIAAYIKALGGETKLSEIKDIHISSATEMQGMKLKFETYQKAPNKIRVEVGSGAMIFSTQIFDGEKGAITSPMGNEELEGDMLEDMKLQAVLNMELHYDKYGIKPELLGIESTEGKEAFKIELTYPSGITGMDFYDVETGFKVKSVNQSGITHYSDYRAIEGIMFPFAIRQAVGPQVFDLVVESVMINTQLEDSLFNIE